MFEFAQARSPKGLIVAQPGVDRTQWLSVELADARSPVLMGDDQTRRPEHPEMLGNCRSAGAKISGELANGLATATQQVEYPPPCWISNRPEHGMLMLELVGNHMAIATIWLHRVKVCLARGKPWVSAAPYPSQIISGA